MQIRPWPTLVLVLTATALGLTVGVTVLGVKLKNTSQCVSYPAANAMHQRGLQKVVTQGQLFDLPMWSRDFGSQVPTDIGANAMSSSQPSPEVQARDEAAQAEAARQQAEAAQQQAEAAQQQAEDAQQQDEDAQQQPDSRKDPNETGFKKDVTVKTEDCGSVQGESSDGVDTFFSVPYAYTAERWSESQPRTTGNGKCWNGTFDARPPAQVATNPMTCTNSRACVQPCPKDQHCDQDSDTLGQENCLTVNIARPSDTKGPLPVMVYIHGGDLTEGCAPETVARTVALFQDEGKPVVLVAMQYRLNAFGFLSVPALPGPNGTNFTGMYGIRDQQQALRWVQRNIKYFNGDPEKVTVFGQSSGGTSVFALVASPASKGLFHRAMSLSGSPNVTMDLRTQQEQHSSVVSELGCDKGGAEGQLACLRSATVSDLLSGIPRGASYAKGTKEHPSWISGFDENIFGLSYHEDGLNAPGLAVADGYTLPKPLDKALEQVTGVDVPMIISNMAQENGIEPAYNFTRNNYKELGFSSPNDQLYAFLKNLFPRIGWGNGSEPYSFVNDLLALYGTENCTSIPSIACIQKLADTIAADQAMTCGNQAIARAAAKSFTKPVYSLYFEAHDQNSEAYHTYDMAIAFTESSKLAKNLRAVWYEFATYGEVKGWTRVSNQSERGTTTSMRFLQDGTFAAAPSWRAKICKFWHEHNADPRFWWSN